jgi:hypothetical protein
LARACVHHGAKTPKNRGEFAETGLAWSLQSQGNEAGFHGRQKPKEGVATMFKKLLVAIGIATLSTSSAFAAKAAPKAPAPVVAKKVAQNEEAKPVEAKGKKAKKAKKGTEEAAPKAAEPAPAPTPAPAPAPAKK